MHSDMVTRRDVLEMIASAALLAGTASSCTEESGETKRTVRKGETMWHMSIAAEMYENSEYTLPDLPYAYDALEPTYDEETLRIHHDKHHATYVTKFNAALSGLKDARKRNDYASVQALSNAIAFNGSGHVLHTLFWHSMKPGGSGEMPADLKTAIDKSFGSASSAKSQFAAAAKAVEGSGWAILALEPVAEELMILQCEKHQNLTIWGVAPLLVCDVWEHAYYLQYQNDRGKWVDSFMTLANWDFAAERLAEARSMTAEMKK